MAARVLVNDNDDRCIALASDSAVLFFHPQPAPVDDVQSLGFSDGPPSNGVSNISRCAVELSEGDTANLNGFRQLSGRSCHGCLGLIGIGRDTFICIITSSQKVATVKPGENVSRITGVEFYCLNRASYDYMLESEINSYPVDPDGWDHGRSEQPIGSEHPCLALRKLLSDGTFYYSTEFDLTNRLQDRAVSAHTFDIDQFDDSFMWNSFMISPLLAFRSRLAKHEASMLDHSRLLTCVIRGFVESLVIQPPMSRADPHSRQSGLPAYLTLISRLSCRRAGTRFNSRGIDDDGNVANFVETETIIWNPHSDKTGKPVEFSYCQVRGSVPVFWEQQTGLLPNQQKIQITRSPEATQPAFDKHMQGLVLKYGAAHVVNLLSETKAGEVDLSDRFRYHINHSDLSERARDRRSTATLLLLTEYDFHAETRVTGYGAASAIRHLLEESSDAFGYYLMEELPGENASAQSTTVLQQEGVFRTNCLDCLDRTNLVQEILSRTAVAAFLDHRAEKMSEDFWPRHQVLWADNGDALSKIYAGTGALKSSFTRTGKMSLGGKLADATKSLTRTYINNFADKDRQNTIDVLLGRLVNSKPVDLFDPVNDWVQNEMAKRAKEYTSTKKINIYVGTFNLNGKIHGLGEDLLPWLRPFPEERPEIVAIGFQEIVELSPQQIMSTDPARRQQWEGALLRALNEDGGEPYVLLRGGQLVGAALLVFVRSSVINQIKNVEGSLKKTGLSGIAGNKGAVAIRLDFANTRLCFVTAHLAAGFSNVDERNRDYQTIANGLRFQKDRTIDNHDAVIWLGDFNYRIGLADEHVRTLVKKGDLQSLYDNDQLHLQMSRGYTFPYYTEATLTFPPTYKFDLGSDEYDTSEKRRIPAWCDRVLWKGDILKQLSYSSAPIRFSDHRPVYATFRCLVSTIDQTQKEQLEHQLYLARKAGRKTLSNEPPSLLDDSDEEASLLSMAPLRTGLPPPSSDQRKWWLDHGAPAKSIPVAPAGHILNPSRPANPFDTAEPDWIKVAPPPSARTPSASTTPAPSATTRRLPPPFDPASTTIAALTARKPVPAPTGALPPPLEPTRPDPPQRTLPPPHRALVPPPKPSKPSALANPEFAPPQRSRTDLAEPGFKPKLPPRSGTTLGGAGGAGLLDDDAGGLGGWEVLKPT